MKPSIEVMESGTKLSELGTGDMFVFKGSLYQRTNMFAEALGTVGCVHWGTGMVTYLEATCRVEEVRCHVSASIEE